MKEEKRYTQMCICPQCDGKEIIFEYDKNDIYHRDDPTVKQCPTCLGSGRVLKTIITTVLIESYTNKI